MNRACNLALGAVAAGGAAMPISALAQQQPGPSAYPYGPHMMGWGGGWYGMVLGPLFMVIVLVIVIAAAVLLVRWLAGPWQSGQPPQHGPPGRTALDILKERYARGEINKEEFEERRRVLGD